LVRNACRCDANVIIYIDGFQYKNKHVLKLLVQNKDNGTKKLLKMLSTKDKPLEFWRDLSIRYMRQVALLASWVAVVQDQGALSITDSDSDSDSDSAATNWTTD